MRASVARRLYRTFSALLFDPRSAGRKLRAAPYYLGNAVRYTRRQDGQFRFSLGDLHYTSYDRFAPAGSAQGHYFHQDLWAARELFRRRITSHVDVGSRLDGFVAHVLPFCEVTYVDLRPLPSVVEGLTMQQGSILEMPFASGSVASLSCLHVIEHIGLGRYGDTVDPQGHLRAAAELARVLAPGGLLLIGTPVGRERLVFDAHRVFDPRTVVAAFAGLELESFALIDDRGMGIDDDASLDAAAECEYGCGLFTFRKPAS